MHSSRREFLAHLSSFGLALAGIPRVPTWLRPRFVVNPFTLGVASGDPSPNGVVLWTRLAPDPLSGGGMPSEGVRVRWEVATDDAMREVVRRGTVTARPDLAHSVHAEVSGLQPGRWYWYRFDVAGDSSVVGRTRTAPAANAAPERLRFAFASCQHYEQGLYTAFQHLAHEDIDFVAHLGDYIYERATAPDGVIGRNGLVRRHPPEETESLAQYRHRYALYKTDLHLQAAHAAFPWIVTWDDHEVDNNYASAAAQDSMPVPRFLLRRAAAYQAYYEHQPLRRASMPKGPNALLYRTLGFGSLARLHVLDSRQYRSDQACGDGQRPACPEWSDPDRTMLGERQERWLRQQVDRSRAAWTVLAQQVAFSPVYNPSRPQVMAMDPWSGYPAARRRLTDYMASRNEKDFVILTGDIHAHFVMDVKREPGDAGAPTVATEFIGTSISSGGDGSDRWPQFASYESTMPTMKYHTNRRGYVRCEVTPERWRADYLTVPFVTRPDAPLEVGGTFVVERGEPGAVRV